MRLKYYKPKYSKELFFTNYPQINQTYFQSSEYTSPEDLENLFKKKNYLNKIYRKYDNIDDENSIPIYMILFDELGIPQKSLLNPLKVFHNKLEYGGKTEGFCFIGINNYSLNAAKEK